jgi:hypothetical protein
LDCGFKLGTRRIGRRAAIELGLGLALTPGLTLAQTDAAHERPHEGDVLVAVGATPPAPLKPDDLTLDAKQTFAWPMDPTTSTVRNGSRLNKVLLLRPAPEGFDPETKERAADGVVAYSAICVHTGCDVTNWHPDRQLLPRALPLSSGSRHGTRSGWLAMPVSLSAQPPTVCLLMVRRAMTTWGPDGLSERSSSLGSRPLQNHETGGC